MNVLILSEVKDTYLNIIRGIRNEEIKEYFNKTLKLFAKRVDAKRMNVNKIYMFLNIVERIVYITDIDYLKLLVKWVEKTDNQKAIEEAYGLCEQLEITDTRTGNRILKALEQCEFIPRNGNIYLRKNNTDKEVIFYDDEDILGGITAQKVFEFIKKEF